MPGRRPADYVGGFAVTTGHGEDDVAKRFEEAGDDYASIMSKALADRLAEAFAERMHQRVRTEFWGYAADENLDNDALIAEAYRGIRPAPGYPAQPDHTEKATLFDLLDAENAAGISLTESFAMWPGPLFRVSISAIRKAPISVSAKLTAIRWPITPNAKG